MVSATVRRRGRYGGRRQTAARSRMHRLTQDDEVDDEKAGEEGNRRPDSASIRRISVHNFDIGEYQ